MNIVCDSHQVGCLKQRANSALVKSPYSALNRITCDIDRGTAALSGEVPSYHLKQIAQEVVRTIDGVEAVSNRIVVETHRACTDT